MKELGRSPQNTHNKRSLIRTSHVCQRRRAAGRNQQVEEYKHTHTSFILTNNYNLSYSKQPKSNPFFSGLVLTFHMINGNLYWFLMKWFLSHQKKSNFQKEYFTFYETSNNVLFLLLSINLNNIPAELVQHFTIKTIYIKMLKFKIKQDEHVTKMKLNKRLSKKI